MSEEKPPIRRQVIDYLREQNKPLTATEIAQALDLKVTQVASVLYQLKNSEGLSVRKVGNEAYWTAGEKPEPSVPRKAPSHQTNQPTLVDRGKTLLLDNPDTEYTAADIAQALDIDLKQAGNLGRRLRDKKFIKIRRKGTTTLYKLNPKHNDASDHQPGKPKPKIPDDPQMSLLPSVKLSMEAENAMQTFAQALMQLENMRTENERLKQALTQILSIGSNAILK